MTRSYKASAAVLTLCLLAGGLLAAQQAAEGLKKGDKAPVFESTDDQGKAWKSTDHVGKKILVIYFYPADLTGGCTKQACGFRDDMGKLADKGVEVVGVSGDSVKNHQLFKKVHKLKFTLLADEEGAVAKKFSVPVKEGGTLTATNVLTGKKITDDDGQPIKLTRGVTIPRWTFVIGKDGKVLYKNSKVDAVKDSKVILALIGKEDK
jgi:peroxiredoxin Q/BCP